MKSKWLRNQLRKKSFPVDYSAKLLTKLCHFLATKVQNLQIRMFYKVLMNVSKKYTISLTLKKTTIEISRWWSWIELLNLLSNFTYSNYFYLYLGIYLRLFQKDQLCNLFVTSKERNQEFSNSPNSPIHQLMNLKCCKMSFKALKMKKQKQGINKK